MITVRPMTALLAALIRNLDALAREPLAYL